jgi:MFS family permease
MTAYFLTMMGCLLMAGRLGDVAGYARVFAWGMVVYSLTTLACGLAQSMGQLVFLRGLQGISGALVFGNSLAIVTNAFPGHQRGRAVGALAGRCCWPCCRRNRGLRAKVAKCCIL